jgi:hypothetical protein
MKLQQINLCRVKPLLTVPYKVSCRTFNEFEPILPASYMVKSERYATASSSVRAAE